MLKAIAWRDRDQNDLRNLLTLNQPVNLEFVEAQIKAITLAMEEEDRLPAFRRLVAEVRPLTHAQRKRP